MQRSKAEAAAPPPIPPPVIRAARQRIIFDISDLILYLRESRVPTGIQRVQLNIIHYAITDFREKANPIIVYFDPNRNDWIFIQNEVFLALY